jgi:hypothetical protein
METRLTAVMALVLAGTPLLGGASAPQERPAANSEQCRVQEMDPRRGPALQTFCLGSDGQWRARPDIPPSRAGAAPTATATGGALPYGWRGRVDYSGTQEGYIQQQARAPRRLTLNNALEALAGGDRREFGGAYQLRLTFDGDAVSGSYSGGPGSNIDSGQLSGTRNGSRCRLFAGQVLIEAECTTDRFVGTGRSQGNGRTSQTLRIDARATDVVDAAEEERRRAEAAAQAEVARAAAQADRDRAAAVAAREAAAEEARFNTLPRASQTQVRLLVNAIEQDSQSWALDQYDRGSLTNVRVLENDGGMPVVRGYYTYNGGWRGWVQVRIASGQVDGILYHNSVFGYANVRVPGSNNGAPATGGRCVRGRDPNGAPIWGDC